MEMTVMAGGKGRLDVRGTGLISRDISSRRNFLPAESMTSDHAARVRPYEPFAVIGFGLYPSYELMSALAMPTLGCTIQQAHRSRRDVEPSAIAWVGACLMSASFTRHRGRQ